jgi:hypothetical protein
MVINTQQTYLLNGLIAEKNAIGIYEVEYDHSNKKDEGYFINTNEQFKFENNKVISYFGTATPKH